LKITQLLRSKPQPVTAELVNAALSLLLDLVSLLFLLFDQIFSAKANFFQMKSPVFLFFPKAAAPRQGETEKCRLIWLTA
jgi:hypothetical protein